MRNASWAKDLLSGLCSFNLFILRYLRAGAERKCKCSAMAGGLRGADDFRGHQWTYLSVQVVRNLASIIRSICLNKIEKSVSGAMARLWEEKVS